MILKKNIDTLFQIKEINMITGNFLKEIISKINNISSNKISELVQFFKKKKITQKFFLQEMGRAPQ